MEEFLKFVVLFLPGLLASAINGTFGSGRRNPVLNYLHVTTIFGLVSYLVLAQIYSLSGRELFVPIFIFSQELADLEKFYFSARLWLEIFFAGIITLFFLGIWLLVDKYQLISYGLRKIGLTRNLGVIDMLTMILDEEGDKEIYVEIYDLVNKVYYMGWVIQYSEYGDLREFLLLDVAIIGQNKKIISQSPKTYVALRKDSFLVNFIQKARNQL